MRVQHAQADNVIPQFVEITGIPYLPMSMAKGLLPDLHSQSVAAARSLALARADVVMLVGARLNWLLGHGESPPWSADAKFVQVDIAAFEFDSNQPVAAPLVGDIGSVISALLERVAANPIAAQTAWTDVLADRRAHNDAALRRRMAEDPHPMRFYNALRAVRDVLHRHPGVYLINEGANALDIARNVIDMQTPRHRLDSGTWGVKGVGMGYAIAAAVETARPVVAIEGEASGTDPVPTVLNAHARHELIAEAFGDKGYHVTTPIDLQSALTAALASNGPAIVDCELDPAAGVESGALTSLNPKSAGISPP